MSGGQGQQELRQEVLWGAVQGSEGDDIGGYEVFAEFHDDLRPAACAVVIIICDM